MIKLSRRQWLQSTALGLGATASIGVQAAGAAKPNIIFILADDLGYGDLGCYGQKMVQTPNLDKMACEGIRFTQCYAGSTVCAPSRCALMTGLHTGHCHIRGNARVPLRPEDTTVAEVLKSAGYATGLIGKWGLGNEGTTGHPNRQGFDYFFGYLDQGHAHNYYPEFLWRDEEKVTLPGNKESEPQVSIEKVTYSQDVIAEEGLKWIEDHKADPFFLYLAFTLPHANNEGGRATGNGMEIPDYGIYAKEPWPDPQKGHAAMISRLDADVGRVLQKLRDLGIAENTLVIFSSDNGPHKEGGADPDFFDSSGIWRGTKRDLYEGGIRVPAMAWWPGTVPSGEVNHRVWAFWDFLPTAADISGASVPGGLDGISLAPTLLAKASGGRPINQPVHEYLYWEFHEKGSRQAIRKGSWKGVRLRVSGTVEVYDLNNDPKETRDMASTYPEIAAEFGSMMDRARTDNEHWPLKEGE
ncbi:MAG: arylsulfatase [Candidatus Hydrogenedentota bacterium]